MTLDDAERARLEDEAFDRKWIADNLALFAPLAREGFRWLGRGAVLVNVAELILRRRVQEGHPFNYHTPSQAWSEADELARIDTRRRAINLLEEYRPEKEFVLALVKHHRWAIYRVALPNEARANDELRRADGDGELASAGRRLKCTDFWARGHPLTTPHTAEWLYRVA
jgi:hypothetical protein